jgi:hypothetical protein
MTSARRTLTLLLLMAAAMLAAPGSASAEVARGDVITEDATLTADVICAIGGRDLGVGRLPAGSTPASTGRVGQALNAGRGQVAVLIFHTEAALRETGLRTHETPAVRPEQEPTARRR